MDNYFQEIREAVVNRKRDQIEGLVKGAIEKGFGIDQIINDGLIVAMEMIGQKYTNGQIYIPEMLASAITMKKGLEAIKPFLKAQAVKPKGIILMGTVQGDIHDIGKNIVTFMLDLNGFEVYDLGIDVPAETFVEKIRETKAPVVGLSGFLTIAFDSMKETIDAIEKAGLRDKVKIIIGGGNMNEDIKKYARADAYGVDAMAAVSFANKVMASTTESA